MKKFPIELNGVANIKMLMDYPLECPVVQRKAIMEQLDYLERYMLALSDAASMGLQPPAWHEVRENRKTFPSMKERMK
jgi:hypothetical protein